MKILKYIAIAGNIAFILWVTYNGIDEGFKGTIPEHVSYIGLILLLLLDSLLILRRK